MAIRKKRKKTGRRPGRRKTHIPTRKNNITIAFRKALPFIVLAAAAALILLFLYAQFRSSKPRKLDVKDLVEIETTNLTPVRVI